MGDKTNFCKDVALIANERLFSFYYTNVEIASLTFFFTSCPRILLVCGYSFSRYTLGIYWGITDIVKNWRSKLVKEKRGWKTESSRNFMYQHYIIYVYIRTYLCTTYKLLHLYIISQLTFLTEHYFTTKVHNIGRSERQ